MMIDMLATYRSMSIRKRRVPEMEIKTDCSASETVSNSQAVDSAGAEFEAIALRDAVGAILLLEPTEADEAGNRLVDALA